LRTVASQEGSYSGSGSAVLSSGSTSSIYAMVSPDAVVSQQHQVRLYLYYIHFHWLTWAVTSPRRHRYIATFSTFEKHPKTFCLVWRMDVRLLYFTAP